MPAEYQPEMNPTLVAFKLQGVENSIEATEQALYEGIIDVFACRGGERWRLTDSANLSTAAGIHLEIGYDAPDEVDPNDRAWLTAIEGDETTRHYEVDRDNTVYVLNQVDYDTEERVRVSSWGGLVSARLLSLLADAHRYTPVCLRDEGDYRSA